MECITVWLIIGRKIVILIGNHPPLRRDTWFYAPQGHGFCGIRRIPMPPRGG